MSQPYRAIQWETGAMGTGCLREVLRKPADAGILRTLMIR